MYCRRLRSIYNNVPSICKLESLSCHQFYFSWQVRYDSFVYIIIMVQNNKHFIIVIIVQHWPHRQEGKKLYTVYMYVFIYRWHTNWIRKSASPQITLIMQDTATYGWLCLGMYRCGGYCVNKWRYRLLVLSTSQWLGKWSHSRVRLQFFYFLMDNEVW